MIAPLQAGLESFDLLWGTPLPTPRSMSTPTTPTPEKPNFSLTFIRHPQAGKHTFEAFRELTRKGEHQLASMVQKLHGHAFDQYLWTPTSRNVAVATALIADGHDPHLFRPTRDVYPEPDLNQEIWQMFNEVQGGNAPLDYEGHVNHHHFANHCGCAAKILVNSSNGTNTLVLCHGTISQQIAMSICSQLGRDDLADEIRRISMDEGDQLRVFQKDGTLSWSFDPLGEV